MPAHDQSLLKSVGALWSELSDGTASVGVRIALSVALAAFVASGSLIVSYVGAYLSRSYPRVHEELLLGCTLVGAFLYLAMLNWVWFRRRRRSAVRRAMGCTFLTVGITAGGLLIADESLRGDSEFVMWGLVLLGVAVLVVLWTAAFHAGSGAAGSQRDSAERRDVRCTECGYCMVGLHESRCPECGRLYTLDELLAEQDPVRSHSRSR